MSADDEARHGQLAWDLHSWLCEGLDASAIAAIEAARSHALDQLRSSAVAEPLSVSSATREALGLPDPRRAAALAEDFAPRLAAAA